MNIDKIRMYYNPERDTPSTGFCPQVSWVEMDIAEKVNLHSTMLQDNMLIISGLLYRVEQLELQNEKLKLALGDTDE